MQLKVLVLFVTQKKLLQRFQTTFSSERDFLTFIFFLFARARPNWDVFLSLREKFLMWTVPRGTRERQ